MNNKKGFTLIEILAVIIILGIVMLITVPAVSKYILNSNRASYAADISAFLETIKSEYDMKDYGSLLKEDEVMIVPFEFVTFEKGNSLESPFGDYVLEKSYAVIVPERKGYQLYANVLDERGMGVLMKTYNELSKESIEEELSEMIVPWRSYFSSANLLSHNGKSYSYCETRDIESLEKKHKDSIIVLCEN